MITKVSGCGVQTVGFYVDYHVPYYSQEYFLEISFDDESGVSVRLGHNAEEALKIGKMLQAALKKLPAFIKSEKELIYVDVEHPLKVEME